MKREADRGRLLALAVCAALLLAAGALWLAGRTLAKPEVFFLRGEGGARWITSGRPLKLGVWSEGRYSVLFRRRLEVGAPPAEAQLSVRALRAAEVYLDGQLVLPADGDLGRWQQARRVDLGPRLSPGSHVLVIRVANENGPALLLAHCSALGLVTGADEGWAASSDGRTWQAVSDADQRRLPWFFAEFPTSGAALASQWAPFALVLLVVTGLTLRTPARLRRFDAGQLRWALIVAWSVLALNNVFRLPMDFGFDVPGHAEYIRFIADHGRLPSASDGWSMFQSPLYYVLAALPYALFSAEGAEFPNDLPRVLLVLPMLCAALQIQLAYRATRRVFPERDDLQALGTLVGGFLPINLYASQHIGNEPLAALFSSATLVLALGMLAPGRSAARPRDWAQLGACLGLALLAKPTAALLVPPLLATLGWKLWKQEGQVGKIATRSACFLGTALLLCGWYYARNWLEVGSPFLVGMESAREIIWWQDPGYRTPRDFVRFGVALVEPLYAGVHGFWDGFYSTLWSDGYYSGVIPGPRQVQPWNMDFLSAGVLLGLLPSLALLIGVVRSPRRLQTSLASLCLAGFFAAQLYLFLTVPVYSMVKATYTLGLIPAYAVLAASGLEPMLRGPRTRAGLAGLLACGAVYAYAAYFVVG